MTTTRTRPTRPRSIKEITAEAEDFTLNISIPLKVWLRTAQMLTQRGDMELRRGDFAQAYMLYWRYAVLITERLKKHPEYKTTTGREAARPVLSQLKVVLDSLGRIKPLVQREYEEWEAEEARREEIQRQQREQLAQSDIQAIQPDTYDMPRRRRYQQQEELDLETHQDYAVELAQREMRRRERERQANRDSAVSADQLRSRRVAGMWDRWTVELADEQAHDEQLFRAQMESARARLDGRNESTEDSYAPQTTTNYSYPSISRSEPVRYDPAPSLPPKNQSVAPSRPPKEGYIQPPVYRPESVTSPHVPPPVPSKYALDLQELQPATPRDAPAVPPKDPPSRSEVVPTAQKSFRPAAYLENGEPLRSIILPRQLRQQFLEVADKNTRQGLEMCGMLCGTDVNNVLVVSCLIIPEQKCTSDTCETENENALLEYCMSEDLLMIGWIHTHPTQTCFMSSRDLHTHAGYQIMLPESIAIVCAPTKQPDHGIFRLTNPPGLPHILDCTQSATFHQHSVDNLYTNVERPHGHVLHDDRLRFTLVDLRPGFRDGPGARKTF